MNHSQLIPSPIGEIELIVENNTPNGHQPLAVICHPHPLYGGTMNNKVVTTVSKALQQQGYMTIRFNFRGIGKSTGSYDEGRGELQDLLTVLQWAKTTLNPSSYLLAGFSFGSQIALAGSLQWPCKQLITIAPPIARFNFTNANQVNCPWLLIQGNEDEIVDAQEVFQWVKTLSRPVNVIEITGATHFFHGKLIELRDAIIKNLLKRKLK